MGIGSGGARAGAGKKRAPLADNKPRTKNVISKNKELDSSVVLPIDSNLVGSYMPQPEKYLTESTKGASENVAAQVFEKTWNWLKERRCDVYINPQLVEQYSMSIARWIQAERAIHTFGFLAKHPTTGMPIASPYVKMSQDFLRQSTNIWLQIFGVIRDNCADFYSFVNDNPNDDIMEKLLSGKM